MKYKSVEELKKMSLEEVAEYVDLLERTDEGAKNNSFEYQEWCGHPMFHIHVFRRIIKNGAGMN